MVIFLFLRNVSATTIPRLPCRSPSWARSAHVSRGLQLEQSHADGAHDFDGLRRRRRHRDDREHIRFIEEGDPPLEAAPQRLGADWFHDRIVTISLIAVLIPLLFMGDIVGGFSASLPSP